MYHVIQNFYSTYVNWFKIVHVYVMCYGYDIAIRESMNNSDIWIFVNETTGCFLSNLLDGTLNHDKLTYQVDFILYVVKNFQEQIALHFR